MIERLWSAWRASYVASVGDERPPTTAGDASAVPASGTVFTQILRSGLSDNETHIIHRGATCFVIANLFPYSSGHVLIVPYREVAELDHLTADETTDLWATVTDAATALRTAYQPDGMNIGLNLGRPAGGSIPDHLHVLLPDIDFHGGLVIIVFDHHWPAYLKHPRCARARADEVNARAHAPELSHRLR